MKPAAKVKSKVSAKANSKAKAKCKSGSAKKPSIAVAHEEGPESEAEKVEHANHEGKEETEPANPPKKKPTSKSLKRPAAAHAAGHTLTSVFLQQ